MKLFLIAILLCLKLGLGDSVYVDTIPKYDRKDYKHWVDEDKNCRDTRQEVFVDEHFYYIGELEFKTDKQCRVTSGLWFDLFTGQWFTDPKDIDIDHTVPLKDAHISGAWAWNSTKKMEYANYLHDPDHLIAVSKSQNRSKGSKSPDKWLKIPERLKPRYCKKWNNVKVRWGLTVTQSELDTLKVYLKDEKGIKYPEVRE